MSENTAHAATPLNKGRIWFNSFIMALASSGGYLIVGLASQHDPMWMAIGVTSIVVVLTPVFYWLNVRRARLGNPPRRRL